MPTTDPPDDVSKPKPPRDTDATELSELIGSAGPYDLLVELGVGGMGIVYKGRHRELGRFAAIKIIHPKLANAAGYAERFKREAKALADIHQPDSDHIVGIWEFETEPMFLAMPLLEGQNLAHRLASREPIPIPEVIRLAIQIARGLSAAHARGLIHCDIKPGNLFLESRPDGVRVKILDFGLARSMENHAALTEAGPLIGTPRYMAPEQVMHATLDPRTDLFAFGCVLYEMATGEHPFQPPKRPTDRPTPPREINQQVPPPLNDLILRLLQPRPEERPASAIEVLHALEAMAPRPAVSTPVDAAPKQQPGPLGGLLAIALSMGLLTALAAFFFLGRERPPIDNKDKPPIVQASIAIHGHDVATLYANGGVKTQADSIFDKQGLQIKLIAADDHAQQVKDYLAGTTPFLRCTLPALVEIADQLGKQEATKPVVFLNASWSVRQHLVARSHVKSIAKLTRKTIGVDDTTQLAFLHDVLTVAQIKSDQVKIERDKAAGRFTIDPAIDACIVTTHEMEELTGGLEKVGNGEGKSVDGAHVLLSTAEMSRSIANVYCCRRDFYDKNRAMVEKFAVGYLKACDELAALKKDKKSVAYKNLVKMTQAEFAAKSEADAEKLLHDGPFVGLSGNREFFERISDPVGLTARTKAALAALSIKETGQPAGIFGPGFDYEKLQEMGKLTEREQTPFPNKLGFPADAAICSFNLNFGIDDKNPRFDADFVGLAIKQLALFPNSVLMVRGHAEPFSVVGLYVKAGMGAKKITPLEDLLFEGIHGSYRLPDGAVLDVRDSKTPARILELNKANDFGEKLAAAQIAYLQELSYERAKLVRKAILEFAQARNYPLDANRVRAEGIGIAEPTGPLSLPEQMKHSRVEVRLTRVFPPPMEP